MKKRKANATSIIFRRNVVKERMADGSVAGSLSTTGDVLRAGIQIVEWQKEFPLFQVSLMVFPQQVFTFSDCGVFRIQTVATC